MSKNIFMYTYIYIVCKFCIRNPKKKSFDRAVFQDMNHPIGDVRCHTKM